MNVNCHNCQIMLFRYVYIGVGSNLGDREAALEFAASELENDLVQMRAVKSITSSPIYETEAWGMPDGTPAFLNQVLCLDTNLELGVLLDLMMEVEARHGRMRNGESGVYADRTLDLDILVAGNEVSDSNNLKVPHPRMSSRRFVLQPLCDLDSELHIPGTNATVLDLLSLCPKTPEVIKYK